MIVFVVKAPSSPSMLPLAVQFAGFPGTIQNVITILIILQQAVNDIFTSND